MEHIISKCLKRMIEKPRGFTHNRLTPMTFRNVDSTRTTRSGNPANKTKRDLIGTSRLMLNTDKEMSNCIDFEEFLDFTSCMADIPGGDTDS